MNPEIQSVIDDSKALLELAQPAFEAQKKVAALEISEQTLTSKVASLEKQALAQSEMIKTAAEEAASFFEARGMLKVARDQFVSELCQNPQSIFTFVQKFTDNFTLKEAGAPSDEPSEANLDPIEAFVRG
jgi:hypothetical protein